MDSSESTDVQKPLRHHQALQFSLMTLYEALDGFKLTSVIVLFKPAELLDKGKMGINQYH